MKTLSDKKLEKTMADIDLPMFDVIYSDEETWFSEALREIEAMEKASESGKEKKEL